MPSRNYLAQSLEFSIIFLSFFISFALVEFIISPLQKSFVSSGEMIVSLLFIPHGIRVVATWLCGRRAVTPLILAELFGTAVLWQPEANFSTMLSSAMIGGLCVYFIFELFRLAGVNLYQDGKDRLLVNWKLLILMASIASVLNSIGKEFFWRDVSLELLDPSVIIRFWVGDTVGVFFCLLLMIAIKRRLPF